MHEIIRNKHNKNITMNCLLIQSLFAKLCTDIVRMEMDGVGRTA